MRLTEESEKAALKLNIKKKNPKIMASSSITLRQIERENVEVVTDFLFLGSKITADGDCSNEIRRQLLFGRKAMTNPLKSTEVCIVKAMVFSVAIYSCESWTVKKAKHQRIDAF